MESKVIKINSENYKWLVRIAGELQKKAEKPVSIDEALTSLKVKREKNKLLDYAGMWKDVDEEKMMSDIKKGWGLWKTKPA